MFLNAVWTGAATGVPGGASIVGEMLIGREYDADAPDWVILGGGREDSFFNECAEQDSSVSQRGAGIESTGCKFGHTSYNIKRRAVSIPTPHTLDKERVERDLLLRGHDAERALVELHRQLLGRRGIPVDHLQTHTVHT